jgi:hypothetical protein
MKRQLDYNFGLQIYRTHRIDRYFDCRMLSAGLFLGVCSLNAKVSERSVCAIFIDSRKHTTFKKGGKFEIKII